MKKLLVIIFCSISLLCTMHGQWQEVNNGLTGGHIGGLFFDPVTSQVFAGTRYCGIFVSDNDGQSWKTANTGLPDMVYNVESFVRSGTNLFAACSYIEGVFLSTDNGKTWVSKKNGLPEYADIHCLVLSGAKIFAGTVNGVYVSIDNGDNWTSANNGLADIDQYINTRLQ